jgi:hypothetical protein
MYHSSYNVETKRETPNHILGNKSSDHLSNTTVGYTDNQSIVSPPKTPTPITNLVDANLSVKKTVANEQKHAHETIQDSNDLSDFVMVDSRTSRKITKQSQKTEKNIVNDPMVKDANVSSALNIKLPIVVEVIEKYADLSYMEVQINLRFLGDLKEGEKVMVSCNKFMEVDQRYAQSIRRWWSSDSRAKTLSFITHLIESAKKYCAEAVEKVNHNEQKQINLEKLINIQKLLGNALTGLGRMVTTYSDDKLNLATIETFRSTITVFCDQDLKRAIANQ